MDSADSKLQNKDLPSGKLFKQDEIMDIYDLYTVELLKFAKISIRKANSL